MRYVLCPLSWENLAVTEKKRLTRLFLENKTLFFSRMSRPSVAAANSLGVVELKRANDVSSPQKRASMLHCNVASVYLAG